VPSDPGLPMAAKSNEETLTISNITTNKTLLLFNFVKQRITFYYRYIYMKSFEIHYLGIILSIHILYMHIFIYV